MKKIMLSIMFLSCSMQVSAKVSAVQKFDEASRYSHEAHDALYKTNPVNYGLAIELYKKVIDCYASVYHYGPKRYHVRARNLMDKTYKLLDKIKKLAARR